MSDNAIALPEPSPRDRVVQEMAAELIAAFAFREACDLLAGYLSELARRQRTHLEAVFLDWRALPPHTRPDFLTYAHHRRDPALSAPRGE